MNFTRLIALAFCLLSSSCSLAAKTYPVPPPPKDALEFFNPTLRWHKIDAKCAGATANLAWKFEGKHAEVTEFHFNGKLIPAKELTTLNSYVSEIDGDVLVWIECSNEGAVMFFIEASAAGTPRAKKIVLHWMNDRISFYKRSNFAE